MSAVHDLVRLRALLGSDAWRWWRERARAELEAGRLIPAVISQTEPSENEREAANRLLATPGATGPVRVRSTDLELLLRDAGIADDLISCLVSLDGPIVNRAAQREADSAIWQSIFDEGETSLISLCALPHIRELLASGLLRRLSANQPNDARLLIRQAVSVLARVRAKRPMYLAELSALAIGDAHALDRDRALGRFVLRLSGWNGDEGVLAWRTAWSSLKVLVDGVSASTLALNLRVLGKGRLARVCDSMQGEPMRFTTRQLECEEISFPMQNRTVFVCENPTVVAAAATELGARCPPIVCVDGWATTPSLLLLRRLEQDGACLRYQGDGDWPGLAIAADLRRHVRLISWRLTSEDLALVADRPGPLLEGERVETPWEPALADALAQRGQALHEEAMLDFLLDDLRSEITRSQ
jgi:uncharacterized protein (TIGR02679 family)